MKKILIPIDFNLNNYDPIEYVIQLFKREACEFYFINTYTYDIDGLDALSILQENDAVFEKPKSDSEMYLGAIVQKFCLTNPNKRHRFFAIAQYASLVKGIKKVIRENEIDLVIIPGKREIGSTKVKYSKNTRRILENIRECPVMIVPPTAVLYDSPVFVLVSTFEEKLNETEIQNWYDFVDTVRGSVKIILLSHATEMTPVQSENLNQLRTQIESYVQNSVVVEQVESINKLKDYIRHHSEYIICLMDRKPGIWRLCGINQSKITSLGPLLNNPLMALHR